MNNESDKDTPEIEYDITPDTHFLESMENRNTNWQEVLAELFDNSFDAAALRVSAEFKGQMLTVADDGHGIENISDVFKLGRHRKGPHTKLGRYGVGLKEAAVWCSSYIRIDTVHKGKRSVVDVDWAEVRESGRWIVKGQKPEDSDSPSGTALTFVLRKGRRAPTDLHKLADAFGILFMPGLLKGMQIVLRRNGGKTIACRAYRLPGFILGDEITDSFSVNGKGVKLHAGIVREDERTNHYGLMIMHEFRVIKEAAGFGAGDYPTRSIAGTLELDRRWQLSENKNAVTDGDYEELEGEVFKRMEALLIKAKSATEKVELHGVDEEISRVLSNIWAEERKETREPRGGRGTHSHNDPPGDSLKRKGTGAQKPDGKRSPIKGVTFAWGPGDDTETIGKADAGPRSIRVELNELNPRLAQWREDGNAAALIQNVLLLAAEGMCGRQIELELPGERKDLRSKYCELLARWTPGAEIEKPKLRAVK